MSGHSKWNNIKRKKEGADAARAKIFARIGKEIAIAVRRRFENRACAPIHVRCSEYETRHSKNLRLIRLHHW